MDVPAAGSAEAGQQGMSGTALSASRGGAPTQNLERAVNSTGSGEHCTSAAALLTNGVGFHLNSFLRSS